jgi:hypothetical protein
MPSQRVLCGECKAWRVPISVNLGIAPTDDSDGPPPVERLRELHAFMRSRRLQFTAVVGCAVCGVEYAYPMNVEAATDE